MKLFKNSILIICTIFITLTMSSCNRDIPKSIYDITVQDMSKKTVSLSEYKGKILLIVNTATHCGFTPQYEGLENLQKKYKDSGFEVLGFPCNQFKSQTPEDEEGIDNFCRLKYGVTFKQFAKIDVNGENEITLYKFLKSKKGGWFSKAIKWNFTKFLIDRNGRVVERYSPTTKPEDIEKDIVKLLSY